MVASDSCCRHGTTAPQPAAKENMCFQDFVFKVKIFQNADKQVSDDWIKASLTSGDKRYFGAMELPNATWLAPGAASVSYFCLSSLMALLRAPGSGQFAYRGTVVLQLAQNSGLLFT